MNDNKGGEFGLAVSFVDQSPSFTNGFEMGILWNRMEGGRDPIEMMIHAENAEQVHRMAKHLDWIVNAIAPIADGWSKVYLSKAPENPHPHLRVIK